MLPAEDRLVLLPKNPGTFFVFWQFSEGREESFRSGGFAPELEIRLSTSADRSFVSSHKYPWQAGKAYVPAPEPGGNCEASLYVLRGGAWELMMTSNQVAAPQAAQPDDMAYASMEFMKGAQP